MDFDPDGVENDVDLEAAEDERMPEEKAPVLTREVLQRWQKAILEVRRLALLMRSFCSSQHSNARYER